MRNLLDLVNNSSSDFGYGQPDLHGPRISKDESTCELLISNWKPHLVVRLWILVSLSTEAVAIHDIVNDLIRAHGIGEKCYQTFKDERLGNDQSEKDFYYRLAKAGLKNFSHMKKLTKLVKSNGKEIVLMADRKSTCPNYFDETD